MQELKLVVASTARRCSLLPTMTVRACRRLALLMCIGATLGCATTGNLGKPPSDDALVNDGTPEAREKLRSKYRIVYEDDRYSRGATADPSLENWVKATILGTPAGVEPHTDQAYNYLSTSSEAKEELDGWLVSVDAFITGRPGQGISFALGAALGIGVAVATSGSAFAVTQASGQPIALSTLAISALFSAAILAAIFGAAFWAVDSWVLSPIIRAFATSGYRDAALLYNTDLDRRILAAAGVNIALPSSSAQPKPAAKSEPPPAEPPPAEPPPAEPPQRDPTSTSIPAGPAADNAEAATNPQTEADVDRKTEPDADQKTETSVPGKAEPDAGSESSAPATISEETSTTP